MAKSRFNLYKIVNILLLCIFMITKAQICHNWLPEQNPIDTLIVCNAMDLSEVPEQIAEVKNVKKYVKLELRSIEFNDDTNIENGWLQTTVLCKSFEFWDSELESIGDNAFNSATFELVEAMLFCRIQFTVISSGAFNGLSKLQFLTFDQVKFSIISDGVLEPLINLNSFWMTDCQDDPNGQTIQLEPWFGNIAVHSLNQLTINQCNLKDSIKPNSFKGLTGIKELYLDYNRIEEIAPRSFDFVLITLRELHLEYNYLTSVPVDLFKHHRTDGKVSIFINKNSFNCSCDLDHFRAFVQEASNVEFTTIDCAYPENRYVLQNYETFCDDDDDESIINENDESHETPNQLTENSNDFNPNSNENPNALNEVTNAVNENPSVTPISPSKPSIDESNTQELSISDHKRLPEELQSPISPVIDTPSNIFTLKCKKLKPLKLTVKNESQFEIQAKNKKLLINSQYTGQSFKFIEFETNRWGAKKTNCMTNFLKKNSKSSKQLQFKREFKSNHLYLICYIVKRAQVMNALDCLTSYNFEPIAPIEPWVLLDDKCKAIIIIVVIEIIAVVIGLMAAAIARYIFPEFITGKKAEKLDGSTVEQNATKVVEIVEVADVPPTLPNRRR